MRALTLSLLFAALSAPLTPARAAPLTADEAEVQALVEQVGALRAQPEALALLVRLCRQISQVRDLAGLRTQVARLAVSRRSHPELAAYARHCVARIEARRGRWPRVERWLGPLAFLDQGLLIGPFEGEHPLDTPLPVETAVLAGGLEALQATYSSKLGPLGWRPLPPGRRLGSVDLSDRTGRPGAETVYVYALIFSETAQAASLRLGTTGPTRAWLGGQLVHDDPSEHQLAIDSAAAPIQLRAGANQLLLRLSLRSTRGAFYVRVADPAGGLLEGVRIGSPEEALQEATSPARGARPRHPTPTALEALKRKAEGPKPSPLTRWAYPYLLAERDPADPGLQGPLHAAEAALEAIDPATPEATDLRRLAAALSHGPGESQRHLEAALRHAPGHPAALLALARHHHGRGDAPAAWGYASQAVAAAPDSLEAHALIVTLHPTLWATPAPAQHHPVALDQRFPLHPELLGDLPIPSGPDFHAQRVAKARLVQGLYPGAWGPRFRLRMLLQNAGELEPLLELYREDLLLEPDGLRPRLRLGELLSQHGQRAEALKVFEGAAALAPYSTRLYETWAEHHLRAGEDARGAELLDRAVALSPQREDLKRLRGQLGGGEGADFAAPYRLDPLELVHAIGGEAPADADLWVLADQQVVKVHKSGLASRWIQRVVKVLTPLGARQGRVSSLSYAPGSQSLEVEEARVLRADGGSVTAHTNRERSLSEPWYRLYYDRSARVIAFPELHPGDVVILSYRLDDTYRHPLYGDYFGSLSFFQETAPVRHTEAVFIGPLDRPLFHNAPAHPGLQFTHTRDPEQGLQVLRWVGTELPKITPEPNAPGWSELSESLQITTFSSWGELAQWWWRLTEPQLALTPELQREAEGLVEGLPPEDLRARVAAIHAFVLSKTRYVGLEFGIHSHQPYPVHEIYRRRFGDCKDKAALTYALLKAVGIDARMTLLRMRRLGRLPPDAPASLAAFNHAILYVPGLDLWLDGTSEFSGTRGLPAQDRGATVLVIDPEAPAEATLAQVPEGDPEENKVESTYTFRAHPEGGTALDLLIQRHGLPAAAARAQLGSGETRREKIEEQVSSSWAGASLLGFELPGWDDLEAPATVQAQARAEALSPSGAAGQLIERVALTLSSIAQSSTRAHPLSLGPPATSTTTIVIEGPGAAPEGLPTVEHSGELLRLSWAQVSEAEQTTFTLRVDTLVSHVPPERYPALRAALAEAIDALTQAAMQLRAHPTPSAL